jgi:hypothetical protein
MNFDEAKSYDILVHNHTFLIFSYVVTLALESYFIHIFYHVKQKISLSSFLFKSFYH